MSLVERKLRRMRNRMEWVDFCRRFVRLMLIALFALMIYVTVTKFVKPPWVLSQVLLYVIGATIPLALLGVFRFRNPNLKQRLSQLSAVPKSLLVVYTACSVLGVIGCGVAALKISGFFPVFLIVSSCAFLPHVMLLGICSICRRIDLQDAAIETDRKTALRERLSTVLLMGEPHDRMEVAVAVDAEAHAKALRAHRVFPIPVWRDFYVMPIPLFLILVASLIPNFSEVIEEKKRKAETKLPTNAQNRLARRLEVLQRELDDVSKPLEAMKMEGLSPEMQELLNDLKKHEMTRSDVYKRISKMQDRIAERKGSLDKQMETAKQLQKLTEADLTKDMVEAMKKGNFAEAQKELEKLKAKLKDGNLTDAERKKLSTELKGLAEALQKMPELAKAMAEAGKKLDAGNLQDAMGQLKISADQLQQLADTLDQMAQLDDLEKAMQEAMKGMQGMGDGNTSGSGSMMSYEALLREMGLFQLGDTDQQGTGMGGPGQGMGGIPGFKEGPTKFKPTKTRMNMKKGDIIGVVKVWGQQVKGEATEKFTEVLMESRQSAEDTLTRENIPLEYRTLVRDWYDTIRPATMAKQPAAPVTIEETP